MVKIAFIGAGSYGFTIKLVADILSFDALRDSELAFVDVDKKRMDRVRTIVNTYLKQQGICAGLRSSSGTTGTSIPGCGGW